LGLTNLSTKRQRIAELARTKSGVALSTLHHVLDLEWMREAYRLTRKDGAPGIDGVTATEYAQNLEANLSDLLERIKPYRRLPAGWCCFALPIEHFPASCAG
jgi:RNA-directed DNA polymerase